MKPYQAQPRYMAYALQEPFNNGLERWKREEIIVPLGVDEMVEWDNNLVLMPKSQWDSVAVS